MASHAENWRSPRPRASSIASLARCLAWWVAVYTLTAAGVQAPAAAAQVAAEPLYKFLFVVETSVAMAPRAERVRSSVYELVRSGALGRMQFGDPFSIWTMGAKIDRAAFVRLRWDPGLNQLLANKAYQFLSRVEYNAGSGPALAASELNTLIKNSSYLVVFLYTDGSVPLSGTRFDDQVNAEFALRRRDLRRVKMPFLTALTVRDGVVERASVHSATDIFSIPLEPVPAVVKSEPQMAATALSQNSTIAPPSQLPTQAQLLVTPVATPGTVASIPAPTPAPAPAPERSGALPPPATPQVEVPAAAAPVTVAVKASESPTPALVPLPAPSVESAATPVQEFPPGVSTPSIPSTKLTVAAESTPEPPAQFQSNTEPAKSIAPVPLAASAEPAALSVPQSPVPTKSTPTATTLGTGGAASHESLAPPSVLQPVAARPGQSLATSIPGRGGKLFLAIGTVLLLAAAGLGLLWLRGGRANRAHPSLISRSLDQDSHQ